MRGIDCFNEAKIRPASDFDVGRMGMDIYLIHSSDVRFRRPMRMGVRPNGKGGVGFTHPTSKPDAG
jgi:hypothetical protein